MSGWRGRAIVVAAAIALAAAAPVSAQFPGGGGTQGGRAGKGGTRGPGGDEREPSQAAVLAGLAEQARYQLREFEEDLKLAPAQRGVWGAYAEKVQRLADDVFRTRNAVRFPGGTAPEQLDYVVETLRNRLTAVEDIADAGKALYAVLTPEQKAVADGRLARISLPLLVPAQAISDGGARGTRPPGEAPPGSGRGR
jgi:hypothetical protein